MHKELSFDPSWVDEYKYNFISIEKDNFLKSITKKENLFFLILLDVITTYKNKKNCMEKNCQNLFLSYFLFSILSISKIGLVSFQWQLC